MKPKTYGVVINGKYNRLTVLELFVDEFGRSMSKCRCDCGNECVVPTYNLIKKTGTTKSCGCLQKERVSAATLKDLTGQTFGNLKVIERAGSYRGYALWLVEAPNGKRKVVRGSSLVCGHFNGTASMGDDIPDTKLGRKYRYFREEFNSFNEFEKWALDNGFTEDSEFLRLDKEKPLSKDNVYFGSKKKYITVNNQSKTITEWAKELGISKQRASDLNAKGKLIERIEKEL